MTPLGLHLRALRERKGVTQKDMAAALNLSPAYLSALEHGKRGTPSYALLERMVGYFNIIWDEAEELHRIAGLSDPRVVIDTVDLSAEATALANVLAERIGTMSSDDIARVRRQLEERASRTTR